MARIAGLLGTLLFGLIVGLCGGATICQITREGACPGGNVSPGSFNETTTNGTVCLGRANYYHNLCQNSGVTTAKALGSGVSRILGNYCLITRKGSCPNNVALANNTFRDIYGEQNLNATKEEPCLQRASSYQSYCGNTGSSLAYFGGTGASRRYPQYCVITIEGNCFNHPEYSNKTFQDISAEDTLNATSQGYCLKRATDFYNWCGGGVITTAKYVPNGAVKYWGNYCLITRNGNCSQPGYANKSFRAPGGESYSNPPNSTACFKKALDFQCLCNMGGNTTATYGSTAQKFTSTVCCYSPYTVCGSSCVNLTSNNNNCGTCGNKCAAGTSCQNGRCTSICTAPTIYCNSTCVDPSTDKNNCGSCGHKCDYACYGGQCYCPAGQTYCVDHCTDLNNDDLNCGSCGNICRTACDGGGLCIPA